MCAYRCKRFQYGTLAPWKPETQRRSSQGGNRFMLLYAEEWFRVKTISAGNNCSGWEHVAPDWFGIEIEWVNLLYWVSLMPPASVMAEKRFCNKWVLKSNFDKLQSIQPALVLSSYSKHIGRFEQVCMEWKWNIMVNLSGCDLEECFDKLVWFTAMERGSITKGSYKDWRS